MPLVKVGSVSKLSPGSAMQVVVEGDEYAVCNAAGEIFALEGRCPHSGGPLGQGALHGTNLVCPWHAWEYDCRTGLSDFSEDIKVETFEVKIDGDDILIDVP